MSTAVQQLKSEMRALSNALLQMETHGGFARWAFVELLSAQTGVGKRTIQKVLTGVETLVDEAFRADERKK